jgi:hypothetical protein
MGFDVGEVQGTRDPEAVLICNKFLFTFLQVSNRCWSNTKVSKSASQEGGGGEQTQTKTGRK